jgi:putative oxidoreductase
VATAEFFGGILVVVGLLTRLAAFSIFIDMFVAITKVHWKNGLRGQGGYEFPLALAALAFALIFFGAGPISLDALIWKGRAKAKA